jgi:hypothetical protein
MNHKYIHYIVFSNLNSYRLGIKNKYGTLTSIELKLYYFELEVIGATRIRYKSAARQNLPGQRDKMGTN